MRFVRLLLLGVLALAGHASAMTFQTVEMTCPFDGKKFSTSLQGSGTSVDAALDMQRVGYIQSPWPLAECPTDGFVFYKDKFSDADLAKLKPLVQSNDYQALRHAPSYYRAYWLRDHLGEDHWAVTWTLIQASWQNHDYAREVVARLPDDISHATGDDQIAKRYLYGEYLRQTGHFDEAAEAFATVQQTAPTNTRFWLLAKYEISLIQAKDASRHMMSEAPKAAEKTPDSDGASSATPKEEITQP